MRVFFGGLATATFLLLSCGGSPELVAPVGFVSVPQEPPPSTITFDDVEQARLSGQMDLYEATLLELTRSEDPDTRRRAFALAGSLMRDHARLDEAAVAFQRAADEQGPLRPFLMLELAEVQDKRAEYDLSVAALETVLRESPESSASTLAALQIPITLANAGKREAAARAVASLTSVKIDELSEERFVANAEALERAGWIDLAAGIRLRLLREYPSGRFTEKTFAALNALGDQSPLLKLKFEESVEIADRLARANRYPEALALLNQTKTRFPARATNALIQYTRTRALFNSRHYTEVINAPKLKPNDPQYLASELLRGRAHWRKDRHREFLQIVNAVIKRSPASREAVEARFLLSRYYTIDARDYGRGAQLLSEVIKSWGNGDQGENLWTLGWIYTLAGRDELALQTFDHYLAAYPDADYTTNALFWSGKIHERGGKQDERNAFFQRLVDQYPYAYYSYRAREILGVPVLAPSDISNGITFPALAQSDGRLTTVQQLKGLGLNDYAAVEMKRIAGDAPSDPAFAYQLAELYVEGGQPLKAISILQRSFRNVIRHGASNVPARFWELLYPRLYWEQISTAAAQVQVDPYLLTSIIRQESGFEPGVVSSAGAVGLMQIMPGEAPGIAINAGLSGPVTRDNLFEPRTNVSLGAAEYLQKLRAMNGNRVLAIASYNAGEDAVGRWVASTSPDDVDVFIDSIPFNETRLYVKNVIRNHHEYRRIYGNGSQS
jgi:soluble lytic murein transglycosylase